MTRHVSLNPPSSYPMTGTRILFVGASQQEIASPKKLRLPIGFSPSNAARKELSAAMMYPSNGSSNISSTSSPSSLASRPAGAYDFVVAVDGGANWCRKYHVKPNAFIGDEDTLSPTSKRWITKTVPEIILCNPRKDDTDFSLALNTFLPRFSARHCWVDCIGVLGGKLEHTLGVLGVLQRASTHYRGCRFTLRGISQTVRVLSHPGSASVQIVSEQLARVGDTFSVIPLTRCVVSESGCEWNLQREMLQPLADRGISNKVRTEDAQVSVQRGVALVLFPNR